MSNYAETKKILDNIRDEYGCKGEVLFRTALQYVLDYGMMDMTDDWCYQHRVDEINERHDEAEKDGKTLWISREFELAILECAQKIAMVNSYDLLVYIQREVYLSNDGIDYQRAMTLLKKCMYDIEERENCENKLTRYAFEDIGFDDYELEQLGFGYLVEDENEEDK